MSPPSWLLRFMRWMCRFCIEPHCWQRQPSRSSTRFLIISYSPLASLSLGCFWRSDAEIGLFCIANLRLSFSEICAGEKISTDHLQAVAPGLIGSEHQPNGFKGPLNDQQLAFVDFEIEEFPRLALFASNVLFDRALKFFSSLGRDLRAKQQASGTGRCRQPGA